VFFEGLQATPGLEKKRYSSLGIQINPETDTLLPADSGLRISSVTTLAMNR